MQKKTRKDPSSLCQPKLVLVKNMRTISSDHYGVLLFFLLILRYLLCLLHLAPLQMLKQANNMYERVKSYVLSLEVLSSHWFKSSTFVIRFHQINFFCSSNGIEVNLFPKISCNLCCDSPTSKKVLNLAL